MGFAYVTSTPGIIKIVEEVLNFTAFMCVACVDYTTKKGDAFLAASIGAFIITGILLIIYILDLPEKITLPWIQIQFFYCLVWAMFYLITAALVIDFGKDWSDPYLAGGVFGLFATVVYLIDAFFKYQKKL